MRDDYDDDKLMMMKLIQLLVLNFIVQKNEDTVSEAAVFNHSVKQEYAILYSAM